MSGLSDAKIAGLADRGVIGVTGPDAGKLLQGLVTNDLDELQIGDAAYAALLSPQGKVLFDFFAVRTPDGFLLDVARDQSASLIKRLTMYKLRANVAISDVSGQFEVLALWGKNRCSSGETVGTVSFSDPRHTELGLRILAEARFANDIASATNGFKDSTDAYPAHRIALGIPEGGKDFVFGDTFPHEACIDQLNGVSFTKGCYVGQEIVSRMEHRGTARKRIVPIVGDAPLTSGAEVKAGDVVIGSVGSVSGKRGLAMIRLDRAHEFSSNGIGLTAGGKSVRIELPAWARFTLVPATHQA